MKPTLTPRPSRRIFPPWSSQDWINASIRSFAAGVMTGPLRSGPNQFGYWRVNEQRVLHLSLGIEPTANLKGLCSLNEPVDPSLALINGDHCKRQINRVS